MLYKNGKQVNLEDQKQLFKKFLTEHPQFDKTNGMIICKWDPSQVKEDTIEHNRKRGRMVHPNSYPIPTKFVVASPRGSEEWIYCESHEVTETGILKSYSPSMLTFTGKIVIKSYEAELAFFLWMHPLNGKGPNSEQSNMSIFVIEDEAKEAAASNTEVKNRLFVESKIINNEHEGGFTSAELKRFAGMYLGPVEGFDEEVLRDRLLKAVKRSDRDINKAYANFRDLVLGKGNAEEIVEVETLISEGIASGRLEVKGKTPDKGSRYNQYWAVINSVGECVLRLGYHFKVPGGGDPKQFLLADLKEHPEYLKILKDPDSQSTPEPPTT